MTDTADKGNIIIYQPENNIPAFEVRLDQETVWLSLSQISTLFGRDKSVISRHIRNIYQTQELNRKATVAKYATVQTEGDRQVERQIDYYNLDMIISVGYRVNSKVGTQFRIWATNVLKQHIIQGYTINEKRLREARDNFRKLKESVEVFQRVVENHPFVDGNKRVAGAMFLWFLEQNHWLYRADGSKRIADNALTALCLMIAQSDPKEKDLIVKVIINLINKDN